MTVAPFQVGRLSSRSWPGREIAACVVVLLVWPLMATVVPFVAVSTRVSLHTIPVIQTFVLSVPCGSVTFPAPPPRLTPD